MTQMQHNKLVGGVDTKSCEMDAQAQAKAEQHCSESRIEFKQWTEDTLKSQSDLRELKRKKAKECGLLLQNVVLRWVSC